MMMTTRVGFYPNLIALNTLLRKEIHRFMRIWSQTLLPPVITMSLYFIIFGQFIGSQLRQIDGYAYIQYIVPGLVIMSVMTNAYANTASSFFLTKFNKSIEEMLVSPMPNFIILLGFTLAGTLRGILIGVLVLGVGFLFTRVPFAHPLMIAVVMVLTAMVFSLGGLVNGIFAKRFDDISFIPTFVLTPLTYLGGVFFSIKQLPPAWQALTPFNPIHSMVDTFRYGLLGVSDLNIYYGMSLVFGLFVAMFMLAWWLLWRGFGIKV